MKHCLVGLALLLGVVFSTGCISLSRSDKEMLGELRAYGVRGAEERVKYGVIAAPLNILPGFGNFYLAIGTDEGSQWLFGFLNLITWPVSVIWGIPEAAIDAHTLNKRETVYYYRYGQEGQRRLEELRARHRRAP